jgi:hypothetical protein
MSVEMIALDPYREKKSRNLSGTELGFWERGATGGIPRVL